MTINTESSVHEDVIQIGPLESDSRRDPESPQGCCFLQWKYPNVLFKRGTVDFSKCTFKINSCMLVYL